MELVNGGFISDILFNMPYNQYYVFGDSCNWGIWCDFENAWTDYQVFGSRSDIAEVKKYNEFMSLTDEEYIDLEKCTEIPSTLAKSKNLLFSDPLYNLMDFVVVCLEISNIMCNFASE